MHCRALVRELWRQHRLSIPLDLRRLAAALGLQVVSFPFSGRIREMIVGRTIGVQTGIPRPWFRWYVAHAIGHHLLHVGHGLHRVAWQWVGDAKAERQAEEFAALLLGGPEGWHRTASELAIPGEKLPLVRETAPRLSLAPPPAPHVSREIPDRVPLLVGQVAHLGESSQLPIVDGRLEFVARDVPGGHGELAV